MARPQLALSLEQLKDLRGCLSWLGQEVGVHCGLLLDMSGQEIVHWTTRSGLDITSIAALAAGDMLATLEIAQMFGGKRTCNLVVQEHDEQTILMARVGEGLALLVVTEREVPLGWTRMAIKQTSAKMLTIVGSAAMTPPPPAVTESFESQFAAQLDTIW